MVAAMMVVKSVAHMGAGAIELQYSNNLSEQILTSYQFYGFYDGGIVWETSENSYASAHESLALRGHRGKARLH